MTYFPGDEYIITVTGSRITMWAVLALSALMLVVGLASGETWAAWASLITTFLAVFGHWTVINDRLQGLHTLLYCIGFGLYVWFCLTNGGKP